MKSMILVAALTLASIANADTGLGFDALSLTGTRTARLEHCGGIAQVSEDYVGGTLVTRLSVYGLENCTYQVINGAVSRIYGSGTMLVSADTTLTLRSESGKTQDIVRVNALRSYPVPARPTQAKGKTYSLRSCGGTVTVSREESGVTLVFRNVEQCKTFDILGSNGAAIKYPQKSLQVMSNGNYAGSFTLPSDVTQFGLNSVQVVLKSQSGLHMENLLVNFLDF